MRTRSYALPEGPVDFAKPFVPERLTPLYYTPCYAGLEPAQRLRYNQLYGLYFNEMLIFFEDSLAETVLGALVRGDIDAELRERLEAFRWEEARHTEMFRALNNLAAPELYRGGNYHFVRAPAPARAVLDWASGRPRLFPLFLWIMLLQEERAVHWSREVLLGRESLEPHFVAAHRLHLADEVAHARVDAELIELHWAQASAPARRLNAALLRWLLGEFFNLPKRAGMRVLERWLMEFPALAPRRRELRAALLGLGRNEEYHLSLYSRESVGRTFAGFDAWPELRSLSRVLLGYRPSIQGRSRRRGEKLLSSPYGGAE